MKSLFIIFVLLGLVFTSSTVSAQVEDYTFSYSSTNVYVSQSLTYTISALDASTEYRFSLYIMRRDLPAIVESIVQTQSCTGSTSCTIGFKLFELVPTNTFAPAQVRDNFGQLLGEHFLAPGVDIAPWATNQQNPADEKTVISEGARPLFAAALGVNHFELLVENGERIITTIGDYTLMHYRTSLADYQNEFIEINVASAASDSQAYFHVEEFVEYNRHSSNPSISSQNIHSFIVLNTSGVLPVFVDQAQNAAFTGLYDNPHTLTMGTGIYNYARLDGAASVKSYGESVWIVSSRKPDWTSTVRPSIGITRNQVVTLRAVEQAVYDAYPDLTLLDCELGDPVASCDTVDSTDYSFLTSRNVAFAVDGTPIENNFVLWQRNATSWQYGQPLTKTNLYFESGSYDIVPIVGLDERIADIVADSGVDQGTMFLIFFLILNMLTYIALFAMNLRSPMLYGLVFLGFGVMFMFSGWFTTWIAIIMGFLMVIVMLAMFKGTRNAEA